MQRQSAAVRCRRPCRLAVASAAGLISFAVTAAEDGANPAGGMTAQARALRCPSPENPRHRQFECHTLAPDFERTLLADLRDVRSELQASGVTPTANYTGALFANTSNPPREGSYGGGLHAAVNLDFGKISGVAGLSGYLEAWWMQAANADSVLYTSLFPANSNFVGNGLWVGQIYLQQTLAAGDLIVAAGRLAPGATFATLPVFATYTSQAINGNPRALIVNEPPFAPPPPGTQWGFQALHHFTPAWQGMLGVFNNNPDSSAGRNHGLDWSWRSGNSGALAVAQVNRFVNTGPGETGMPGQYSIGFFVDGNRFATVSGTPETVKGKTGAYLMAQQQITRPDGAGSARGVTIWGAVAGGGPQDVNLLPLFVAAGMSWQGPSASRPQDNAAIGWYYGKPSNTLQPPASNSQSIELNYQYAITRALNLLLDAQYVFRVNGLPSPGMAVVGLQLAATF